MPLYFYCDRLILALYIYLEMSKYCVQIYNLLQLEIQLLGSLCSAYRYIGTGKVKATLANYVYVAACVQTSQSVKYTSKGKNKLTANTGMPIQTKVPVHKLCSQDIIGKQFSLGRSMAPVMLEHAKSLKHSRPFSTDRAFRLHARKDFIFYVSV